MELVQLERFALDGPLGSGADYDVHAATDTETGKAVVLKRPVPGYISRGLHHSVERVSERLMELHSQLLEPLPGVAKLVGYTDVVPHDGYFGDGDGQAYRVLVEERAVGLPLSGDIRDKFKGVPVALGQNLFALHPLVPNPVKGRFAVQLQLIEVEEALYQMGHLALDMRPQNVFFDSKEGGITLIDIGTSSDGGAASQGRATMGSQPRDFHDFFAEVFRYYAMPSPPPAHISGYGDPVGMKNIPDFKLQMDMLAEDFLAAPETPAREAALGVLSKIGARSYSSFEEFRRDFHEYLGFVEQRILDLPNLPGLTAVWRQASETLSGDYWKKFLFDADVDMAPYRADP